MNFPWVGAALLAPSLTSARTRSFSFVSLALLWPWLLGYRPISMATRNPPDGLARKKNIPDRLLMIPRFGSHTSRAFRSLSVTSDLTSTTNHPPTSLRQEVIETRISFLFLIFEGARDRYWTLSFFFLMSVECISAGFFSRLFLWQRGKCWTSMKK